MSKYITRLELVKEVSDKLEVNKVYLPYCQVNSVIVELLKSIKQHLKKGDNIQLRGFGTFKTVNRAERKARHPKNGDMIDVPEKTIPKLIFGKDMKQV